MAAGAPFTESAWHMALTVPQHLTLGLLMTHGQRGGMKKIRGFLRNHLGAAIAGATTAVVLVGGLLILTLVGGGSSAPAAANVTSPPTTVAPTPPAAPASGTAAKRQGVRGQVTAITGSTWTVMSARGVPVTVDVTSSTMFGTKAAPLTATNFAVGDQIVVAGTRTKGSVTASRIAKAPAGGVGGVGGANTKPTTA
jgi:hypothetical protein